MWPGRSHAAGTLRLGDEGSQVVLCGWVDRNRNMGGVQFFDIRDHSGLMQVRGWCMAEPWFGHGHCQGVVKGASARDGPHLPVAWCTCNNIVRRHCACAWKCCSLLTPWLAHKGLLAGVVPCPHPSCPSPLSIQVICEPQTYPEVSKVAARLRNEYVVRVEGVVRKRKDPNPRLATGEVELLATQVCVRDRGGRGLLWREIAGRGEHGVQGPQPLPVHGRVGAAGHPGV